MSPTTEAGQWSLRDSFGSLLVAFVVAAGTLSALGVALHGLDHHFSFSFLRALHESWAWMAILVISGLWLATGLIRQIPSSHGRPTRDRPMVPVGRTSRADAVLLEVDHGRYPSHRPGARRKGGDDRPTSA